MTRQPAKPGTAPRDELVIEVFHNAVPPSLNRVGMRGSYHRAHRFKKRWELDLATLLLVAKLPRHLDYVQASAVLTFPERRVRDDGNFSWLLEKALGDALRPNWIPDDTPAHYRFLGVTFNPETGPHRTVVRLQCRREAGS